MTTYPNDNMIRTGAKARVWEMMNSGVFHGDLCDLVREKFNCVDAEITDEGEIWIANPQRGHWLNDDMLVEFVDWAKATAGHAETAKEIKAAGYIAQDKEGYAIAGFGATEAEAREAALPFVGPWEDRDGNTVGVDDPEFGFDAKFVILPATAALISEIQSSGGAIAWGNVDGIACTREEETANA